MTDCNKVIKDIEYAKDLLQNRPEQDTIDYKVWEVLDDALDLINDLRSQIAMLIAAQHTMAEIMGEKQNRIDIEQTFDQTYGVTGGICPTCGNWIQSAHSFCGFCGQPIGWKKRLFADGIQQCINIAKEMVKPTSRYDLLKEQEAKTVIKIAKRFNDCDLTGYCPSCSRPLIKDWAENYCGFCGKPILWEGR